MALELSCQDQLSSYLVNRIEFPRDQSKLDTEAGPRVADETGNHPRSLELQLLRVRSIILQILGL